MKFLQKIKHVAFELGISPFLTIATLIVLVTILLLGLFIFIESKLLIGFLGIITGSVISAVTSLLVAKESYRGQLRVASLDKRLNAHQAAYALWYEIVGSVHHPERIADVVIKAQDFWKNNCLYLNAESRKAFRDCMMFAVNHEGLLKMPRNEEAKNLIRESWEIIMKPGTALVEGVSLPGLSSDEYP